MPQKTLLALLLILLCVLPLHAQDGGGDPEDPEAPAQLDIEYDDVVNGTITDSAIFDQWRLDATRGDIIVITMSASDGLAPLIGILDEGFNLIASSDVQPDGTRVDAEPDSVARLEYVAQNSGLHVIVATRAGNVDGASSGSYVLEVRRANPGSGEPGAAFQDVIFRCGPGEATTAATLSFVGDGDNGYRISVFGLDGFAPVVRVTIDFAEDDSQCGRDGSTLAGAVIDMPGMDAPLTINDAGDNAVQVTIGGERLSNVVTLNIGSMDSAPGRYIAVIEGLSIAPAGDEDLLEARIGPLAAQTTTMQLYMIAVRPSRLDPLLELLGPEDVIEATCDDAGRRGCEALPDLDGYGLTLPDERSITGTRFDAGLTLAPGDTSTMNVNFRSRSPTTTGFYAIFISGELPPRASNDNAPTDDESEEE